MTTLQYSTSQQVLIRYDDLIEQEIGALSQAISTVPPLAGRYRPRWLAIQLLEGDSDLVATVEQTPGSAGLQQALAASRARLHAHYGDEVDVALADGRYRFVHQLVSRALTRPAAPPVTRSDRIDRIVTHRLLGIPIFLMLMWVVFKLTTDVAAPMLDWVDGVISGPLTRWALALLTLAGLNGSWVESLVLDGVIAGVGGVLVFVPVLLALYLALGLLEDSGYMARAAFVVDRLMQPLGLHGKSFLPMIVGFGCSVPGVYATRTLENEKDRILTGLLVPFMSCSARLPVYVLIAAVFFPQQAGLVIFSLYLTGILVAIVLGVVFKGTLFRNTPTTPFVLELPPYRLPTFRGVWTQMWERTAGFVRKAWTIILATSVVVWLLLAIPVGGAGTFADTPVAESAFAALARGFTPVFEPLGFGSWQTSGALVTGFVAKEVVVGTMAQVYAVAEASEAEDTPTLVQDLVLIGSSFGAAAIDTLKAIPLIVGIDLFAAEDEQVSNDMLGALRTGFEASSGGHGALAALAFLVFVLLYTPCMVAVAAIRHELGNRWMWFSILGQFAIAWLAALLVFQGGLLLGLG